MKVTIQDNDKKHIYVEDIDTMQVFKSEYPSDEEQKLGLYYWIKTKEVAHEDEENFSSAMIVHCPDYRSIGAIILFPNNVPIIPVKSELIIHGEEQDDCCI